MVCDKHCQVLYLIMILNIFLKFVLIESSIPILLHYQLQGRWSKFDSIRFLSYSLAQKKSKLKGNTIRHYGISCQSDFKEKQNIWRVFSCGRMQRISNLLIKNQRLLASNGYVYRCSPVTWNWAVLLSGVKRFMFPMFTTCMLFTLQSIPLVTHTIDTLLQCTKCYTIVR